MTVEEQHSQKEKMEIGEFEINSSISGSKINIHLLRKYFEKKLDWEWVIKEFNIQEKSSLLSKFLKDFLKQKNLEFVDIKNAKIIAWGKMLLTTKKETFSFDLYAEKKEDFYKWDEQKIYAENFALSEQISKISTQLDKAVDAMDYIFEVNDNEYFDILDDEEDVLNVDIFWEYLKWKNLNQISSIIKKWLSIFDKLSKKYKWKHEANNKILETKQRFLHMLMWIWDKYEWWAEYLKKTSEETLGLLGDIVESKSIIELLSYVKDVNIDMDRNNYQSTPVEDSYKLFSISLNKSIFEKFKQENATEKQFLEFAKIISWKNESYRPEWMWWEAWVDDNLSSNSENMIILNDIIMHLMTKNWWIMEKLNNSQFSKLEDEKIWNKDTYKIVKDFEKKLSQGLWYKKEKDRISFIKWFWYWDILKIKQGQKYSDLTFEQKAKISVIYRVLDKLDSNKNLNIEILSDLFTSISVDLSEKMVENMTDIFQENNNLWEFLWGKSAKEFWLIDETDIEIFNFFKDFQWVWALDFSNRSISNMKTTGKFVAVVAAAMAIIPITWLAWTWALTQWAVMWATASVASIAINPKWYDSIWEWITDITTDILVWAITWLLWWKLVQMKWVEYLVKNDWTRILLTNEMKISMWVKIKEAIISPAKYWEAWFKLNKAIFASDLIFLWLIPEAWRMMLIDWLFHKESIFIEKRLDKL